MKFSFNGSSAFKLRENTH